MPDSNAIYKKTLVSMILIDSIKRGTHSLNKLKYIYYVVVHSVL